jgi:hypothetical protein
MGPCFGGTNDDYMGISISVNNPVNQDTTFSVTVYYEEQPTLCPTNYWNSNYQTSFSITILSGNTFATIDECSGGLQVVAGANICGTCIVSCDNPSVALGSFSC